MAQFMNRFKKPLSREQQSQLSQNVLEPKISREAIAKRAYEKFCARGGKHGSHEQDWLEAEAELKAEIRRN